MRARTAGLRLALAALAAAAVAGAAPARDPSPLAGLAWMAGCWASSSGEALYEEQWMAPRGTLMPGMSRATRGGHTVAWEQLHVREEHDRALVYRAEPSGQAPAEFRAVEVGDGRVVFANPAHDFPRRVAYRRAAAGDSLRATVSGGAGEGGAGRTIEFRMARVACPGAEAPR